MQRLPGDLPEDLVPQQKESHGLSLQQFPTVARMKELGHEASHRVVLPFSRQMFRKIDQNLQKDIMQANDLHVWIF